MKLTDKDNVTPLLTPDEDLPGDAYVAPVELSDDDLLASLLSTPDENTMAVKMPRFKTEFIVRSITAEEYSQMEERCKYTVKNNRTHQLEHKIDQDKLSYLLIAEACVRPNFADPKLLEKYKASSAISVVKKRLLIGEVTELTQSIMDVSGFGDGVTTAKN